MADFGFDTNPWASIPMTLPVMPGVKLNVPPAPPDPKKDIWDKVLQAVLPHYATPVPAPFAQQQTAAANQNLRPGDYPGGVLPSGPDKSPVTASALTKAMLTTGVVPMVQKAAQAVPRILTSFGLDVAGPALGVPADESTYQPQGKVEQALLGSEPIKAASQQLAESQSKTEDLLNKTKVAGSPFYSKALATGIAPGLMALGIGANTAAPGGEGEAAKITEDVVGKDVFEAMTKRMAEGNFPPPPDGGAAAKSFITNAAMDIGGKVYEAPSHGEAIQKAIDAGADVSKVDREAQGQFRTSDGRLISRVAAKTEFGIDHSEQIPTQFDLPAREKTPTPPGTAVDDLKGNTAGNIRVDKISTNEEVQNIIRTTHAADPASMETARGGTISVESEKTLAQQSGLTLDQLTKVKSRPVYSASEVHRANQLLAESADQVKAALDKVVANPNDDQILLDALKASNRHSLIQQSVTAARAEPGRALNMMKQIAEYEKSPSDALLGKVFDLMGGKEQTTKMIADLAAAKKLAEATGDNSGFYKLMRQFSQATGYEQFREYYINSILSGPPTLVAKMSSEFLKQASTVAERYISATLDLIPAALGKGRKVTFSEANSYLFGLIQGITEGVASGLQVALHGPDITNAEGDVAMHRLPAIGGILGKIVRTPGNILSATSELWRVASEVAERNAQAMKTALKEGLKGDALGARVAELRANPTEDMLKAIRARGAESTFRQPTPILDRLLQLRDAPITEAKGEELPAGTKNKISVAQKILHIKVPFAKTIVNLTKSGLQLSPLGIVDTAIKMASGEGREAILDAASKSVVGTTLAAAATHWALDGRMSGSNPPAGVPKNSFKVGNQWISYARVEPFAMLLGATADAVQTKQLGGGWADTFTSFAISAGKQIDSLPFMQSFSDLFSIMAGKSPLLSASTFKKMVITSMVGIVPNALSYVAKSIDPIYHDTNDSSFWGQFGETLLSKVPFASKLVPASTDEFGQPEYYGSGKPGVGGAILRGVSPFYTQPVTKDPVLLKMQQLNLAFSPVAKTPETGGIKGKQEDYGLYKKYADLTGAVGHAILEKVVTNPKFGDLADTDQITVMKKVMADVRAKVKDGMTGSLMTGLFGFKPVPKDNTDSFNSAVRTLIANAGYKKLDNNGKISVFTKVYLHFLLQPPAPPEQSVPAPTTSMQNVLDN